MSELVPEKTASEAQQNVDSHAILRRDNEEYTIVKKLPKRFPTRPNDIYITNRTNFKAQLVKCQKLLEGTSQPDETNEIFLHAMGPAINRAINLSLRLQEKNRCTVECFTGNILLEDDLMPLLDSLQLTQQHRNISSVHLKISPTSTSDRKLTQ